MKNIFSTLLLLFITVNAYTQQWEFTEVGNAFDGFGRMSFIKNDAAPQAGLVLAVVNSSGELTLIHGTGDNGMMSKLFIRILLDEDFINSSDQITKVLMSFDEEKNFYQIGQFFFDKEKNTLSLGYAFSNNFNTCLNKLDMTKLFKLKQNVHFRVFTIDNYYDISFVLQGSSVAINKTFQISDYKKAGDWTDFAIEAYGFMLVMAKANSGKDNLVMLSSNCLHYLEKKYGQFYYIMVNSVFTNKEETDKTIDFYDNLETVIAEIPFEVAFRNIYFFSGNIKKANEKRYEKDLETLRIYYDNFSKKKLINNSTLSFEDFCNLDRTTLTSLLNKIKADPLTFDWLRAEDSLYIYYDKEEYTINVFIEPWGI
jgi:hypothetical protein